MFICLSIDVLFVMIISLGVCRASKLGSMAKNKMLQNCTTTLIDDINLFVYLHHVRYHLNDCCDYSVKTCARGKIGGNVKNYMLQKIQHDL